MNFLFFFCCIFKHRHEPVSDLFIDLRDGNKLLTLLEVLESKTHVKKNFFFLHCSSELKFICIELLI